MTKRWKKPPVKTEVRREWLRRYEEDGESPPQIATADGFDVRTVRSQIERAKEEREVREARSQVLRNALENHYADLYRFAERLKSEVTGEKVVLLLLGNDPMWSALREHLPRSPIWKYLGRWDDMLKEIDGQQEAINSRLENEVGANEKLNRTLSGEVAIRVRFGLVAMLAFQAKQWARGQKGLDNKDDFVEEPAGENFFNLKYSQSQIDKLEKKHIATVKKVMISFKSQIRGWEEYENLQKLYTELKQLKSKLQDELAIIIYRRIVPGRCKYCPL